MKLIGQGWQYKVYDLENGRIRKVALHGVHQYWNILHQNKFRPVHSYHEQQRVIRARKDSVTFIKSRQYTVPQRLLAKPSFLGGDNFEQDKLVILSEIFHTSSEMEQKQLLDKFVLLILETWKYGFADTVYNFLLNNGLTQDGNLVLADFGEITYDKNTAAEDIKTERWKKADNYLHLSRPLQEHYDTLTERHLTLQNLDMLWQKASHP
jgi:hypothetical protein